ncbi:hypothetical protein F4604DRAFT_1688193 [Suillus subluteus]|nr:hypothetical protein F4604DRAFT_1688193 [Suillus subluteus]
MLLQYVSLASDGIEIVDEELAQDRAVADVTSTSHGKWKGKIVPSEELESDILMDGLLTDVILKADVKGKGKAVASLDDTVEDCGRMQSQQKRPRDASGSRPPVKQTVISSLLDDATPQWRPWFDDSLQLPVAIGKKHKSGGNGQAWCRQCQGSCSDRGYYCGMSLKSQSLDVPTRSRKVQGQSWSHHVPHVSIKHPPKIKIGSLPHHTGAWVPAQDEDMLVPDTDSAGQAAPPTLSVPPIATLSLVPPSMLPARNQTGTQATEIRHSAITEELEMDVSGDGVASMNALKMEVAVLKGCNATETKLLEAIKVRLAAHDADIQTLDGMCMELAALQEDVKAVQAESRTQEEQLQAAEAKLASQSHTTAVLQDTYEALRQQVVSNVYGTSYNQGFMLAQVHAMEQMFLNFTLGPSTVGRPSVANSTGNSRLNGVAGSSNQAAGSSEVGQVFSELASGMGPN